MNTNEILKADMLDIIFDNRNKTYGAYVLRKDYDRRLAFALLLSIGLFFLLGLFIYQQNEAPTEVKNETEGVVLTAFEMPKEEIPPKVEASKAKQPAQPVLQKQYVNNIKIVADNAVDDKGVPPIDDLEVAAISSVNADGAIPTTNESPTMQEAGGNGNGNVILLEEEKTYDVSSVEVQPEYPGGMEAFQRFLSRHLVTPEGLEAGEKRTVVIRFIIDTNGIVTGFEVLQSAGDQYDREVMRVLKKMPKWRPAMQNRRQVAVMFKQPVTFMAPNE